jgi:hypothetical protein
MAVIMPSDTEDMVRVAFKSPRRYIGIDAMKS